MEITSELKQLLKALRLSTLLSTLPERVAYANARRLLAAKVDHDQVLERFD